MRPAVLILAPAIALAAAPRPARAAEAGCWFENGVVVVAAEVAGVAGDYILDTGAPQTLLAETQAEGAGYAETALTGEVRLAGARIAALPIAVRDLDVRTGLLPTPIAGIIGADALKGQVVDVAFAPCRVAVHAPGQAPGFAARASLRLDWISGVPAIRASAADGPHVLTGAFTLATGSDTAVRISDALAKVSGAGKPQELYPYGVLRPRLRALSLAGRIAEQARAGLIKPEDPRLAGEIGAPLLSAWRLRFDFPAGRLRLAPR
jgi:hypothetical protein